MATTSVFDFIKRSLPVVLIGLLGCARSDGPPKQEKPVGLRASLDGDSKVSSVVFSPDGRTLAVGSETDAVRVWDIESGKELFRLAGAINPKAIVFSPDGSTLATACGEPIIRFWDAKSGQEKTAFRGEIGKVELLAFSPDGATLASWSEQDFWAARMLLWDVHSGMQKKPLNLPIGFATSIRFSPDSQTLAESQNGPDGVDFWNLATRTRQFVAIKPAGPELDRGWVGEVYFCSDGRKMAFYQQETVVTLWDLDKQREQSAFKVAKPAMFPNAALRFDGKLAAIGEADGILTLWNPETDKKVAVVGESRLHVPDACFSPDGRTMATYEIVDSVVKIWDVPTLIANGK